MPLNQYIEKNITSPLGLTNTGSHFKNDERMMVHLRGDDGSLVAVPDIAPGTNPEKFGGGHYLISTLDDYAQFLLAILNKGTHPRSKVKILEEKTCDDYLFTDMLPGICSAEGVGKIPSSIPSVTSTGQMLPGTKLGWSCGFMLNIEDTRYGRKQGSGQWAGLGNLYYWVDPTSGLLGLIMSSVLPFFDKEVLYLYDALEKAAYGHADLIDRNGKEGGEGCNYSVP
jgi:CubicO group peptidase (beta-lactamase class C family)